MKITLQMLKDEAKALGMVVRKRDGEFRVAFPGNEASAYYTTDADDALDTMRAMRVREDEILTARLVQELRS